MLLQWCVCRILNVALGVLVVLGGFFGRKKLVQKMVKWGLLGGGGDSLFGGKGGGRVTACFCHFETVGPGGICEKD